MNRISQDMRSTRPFSLIIIALLILAIVWIVMHSGIIKSNSTLAGEDQRVQLQPPLATETLNKEYAFSLRDSTGREVSKIKYEIISAEKRNEIIVKGQKATAVKGRSFLILNLKITNVYSKTVQIDARDYVRLMVNNSDEKLAPDIHNDPVEVQAISTKYTRLGFPINESDTNLTIQIGEINGNKESIKLELK